MAIQPRDASAHSELAFALQYRPGVTVTELSRVHREWNEQHGQPLRCHWRAHRNQRDPQRPLRVGFVSPDFGHHPVGIFVAPVLEHLGRHDVLSVCYSDRSEGDEQTARIQAAAGLWRDDAAILHMALRAALWGGILPLVFAVCHRMIPFFTQSAVPAYTMVRPLWWLVAASLLFLVHLALSLAGAFGWLWAVDAPAAALTLYCGLRWQPSPGLSTRSPKGASILTHS